MGEGRESKNNFFDLGASAAVRVAANTALFKMYEVAHSTGLGGSMIWLVAIINAGFAAESLGKGIDGKRGNIERGGHGVLGLSASALIVYLMFIHHEPGFWETWGKKAGGVFDSVNKKAHSVWNDLFGPGGIFNHDAHDKPPADAPKPEPQEVRTTPQATTPPVDRQTPSTPSSTDTTSQPPAPSEPPPPAPEVVAPTSLTHPIETSVTVADGQGDIKLLRALGDDLFLKLKAIQPSLTPEQIRNFFPEGSLQDRLVTARLDGNLGSVSEQISIETGNYRPGEPANSRNVFKGSRLILNSDGSVTRVWDGGAETVSDADGHLRRYGGAHMITPRKN